MMVYSLLLTCCSRRSAALPTARVLQHRITSFRYGFQVGRCITNGERVRAVMEGFPRASSESSFTNSLSKLSKTRIRQMKKDELRTELSFCGMDTEGLRKTLVTRLLSAYNDEAESESEDGSLSVVLDPATTYCLRVKGRTTQNSSGAGLGLVLCDPTNNNRRLWSGRIYASGNRSSFEAEYSAIIMGVNYVCQVFGARKLILQMSNEAIVNQVHGLYRTSKDSLTILIDVVKEASEQLDEFSIEEIDSAENAEAETLANKALASRKSLRFEEGKVDDPVHDIERKPGKMQEADDPAQSAAIDPSRVYLLRFDGGSRGNPGVAAAGMVIYDDEGQEIWSGWKFHEEAATNNFAEYLGLLCGMRCIESFGIRRLIVEGDSQLIVRQLNGEYRCKEETLKKFYYAITEMAERLDYFEIRHIPRAENKRADWLANHAMDLQDSHGFDEIQTDL